MYRTTRNSLVALALAGAIALLASPVAHAASSSSPTRHELDHTSVIQFRWSLAQFELDPETGLERPRVVHHLSPWFLAFDSGWQQVGDHTVPPRDHWTPPWAWPFSESNQRSPVSFDDVPWHCSFDEWLQHLPTAEIGLPPDPGTVDGPTVPEPFLAATLLSAGAGAVALLRRRRTPRCSHKLPDGIQALETQEA